MFRPHFRARIEILPTAAGGPQQSALRFPESGVRAMPAEFPGIAGRNSLQILCDPNVRFATGEAFEADCRVLVEELFAAIIAPDLAFGLWDGRIVARGVVTKIYRENWGVGPEVGPRACCPRCGASWIDPGRLDPELLRDVAALFDKGEAVRAIGRLRRGSGMSLSAAKGVTHHMSAGGDACHHCRAGLPAGRSVICSDCGALNYRWLEPANLEGTDHERA